MSARQRHGKCVGLFAVSGSTSRALRKQMHRKKNKEDAMNRDDAINRPIFASMDNILCY